MLGYSRHFPTTWASQVLLPSGGGPAVAVARVEVPEVFLERRAGRVGGHTWEITRGKTQGIIGDYILYT